MRAPILLSILLTGCGVAGAQCSDGLRNGTETDVDCGGGCANRCVVGKACQSFTDCASGRCDQGTCVGSLVGDAASCVDGIRNGEESDIDCGGICPSRCVNGRACRAGGDCALGSCIQGQCAPTTCANGVKDAGESDVDCGGPCAGCMGGRSCQGPADCASRLCTAGACTQVTTGSTRPCPVPNGVGSQTYDGTGWSACTPTACDPTFHLEAGACASDTKVCTVGGNSGTQTWTGAAYGACVPSSCTIGAHLEGGACVSDTKACAVPNGMGTQTWTGTGYGPCVATSCQAMFHVETGACASDTRPCMMGGNSGTQTWTGTGYGACVISSCMAGTHLEGGSCVSDTRSCTIQNGTGSQLWNGSGYGTCSPVSCNGGFHIEQAGCVSNTKPCAIVGGTAVQTWTGTVYGRCSATACNAGFELLSRTDAGGTINVCACLSGSHLEGTACVSNTQPCTETFGAVTGTGTKTWSSSTSTYGPCDSTSCTHCFVPTSGDCAKPLCASLTGTQWLACWDDVNAGCMTFCTGSANLAQCMTDCGTTHKNTYGVTENRCQ